MSDNKSDFWQKYFSDLTYKSSKQNNRSLSLVEITKHNSSLSNLIKPNSILGDIAKRNSSLSNLMKPNSMLGDIAKHNSSLSNLMKSNSMLGDITKHNSSLSNSIKSITDVIGELEPFSDPIQKIISNFDLNIDSEIAEISSLIYYSDFEAIEAVVIRESEEIKKHIKDLEVNKKTTNRILLSIILLKFIYDLFTNNLSNYVYDNFIKELFAQKNTSNPTTIHEVRSFTRSNTSRLDYELLKNFRMTTADALNLRKTPKMSSEIITTLPIATIVEIIDKSDRSWLYVAVEIDGEIIEGWVSRRYTAYFK